MFRQMAEDHFVLYLMLMSIIGFTLGALGTLAIYVILAWQHVAVFLYSVFERGVA
jgi:hypothetical protein